MRTRTRSPAKSRAATHARIAQAASNAFRACSASSTGRRPGRDRPPVERAVDAAGHVQEGAEPAERARDSGPQDQARGEAERRDAEDDEVEGREDDVARWPHREGRVKVSVRRVVTADPNPEATPDETHDRAREAGRV
jgi:hypothetical protein